MVIMYSFNSNISPKMPYGVLECDIVMLQNHACDFVIKYFVIKRGVIYARPCIFNIVFCLHGTFHSKNKKVSHTHSKLNYDGESVCCRGRQISESRISPASIMTTYFYFAQLMYVAV